MKKITIIGSESFLARNFIKYIEGSSEEYDLFLYDYCIETHHRNLFYKQIDFNDPNSVLEINYNTDAVMLFLGRTGTVSGFSDYRSFVEVNEIILLNILSAYVKKKSEALFIYPSSRLIYKGDNDNRIDEDASIELKSIYAVTKYASEQYLKIYSQVYGLKYVVVHICTPIGSLLDINGNYGTFEIFTNQAVKDKRIVLFGDGKQKKTFTAVEDVCEAFKRIILKGSLKHTVYNIGGQELSLYDIAKHVANEYNVPVEYTEWPRIDRLVDGGTVVFDSKRFDEEFNMTYKSVVKEI